VPQVLTLCEFTFFFFFCRFFLGAGSPSKALWVRLLRESGVTVHVFPEEEGEGKDLSKVHFAYIGKNFAHVAEKLPNLKGIQCMSAGMNHIIERVDICRCGIGNQFC